MMNVFRRFTLRSLRQNRLRTLVTIIGITLSMSLLTAVIEGAYSGIQYILRIETSKVGAFHGYYSDLDDDAVKEITSDNAIKDYAVWKEAGWAEIGSANEYKPYLLIKSVSSNFTDMVAVDIIEGRMPENDKEILLPEHLKTNGKVIIKTGDEITLSVGKRMYGEDELYASVPFVEDGDESIEDTSEKTYKVVGTYARFDAYTGVEDYICPGYTALTCGEADGRSSVFFTLKNPLKYYDFVLNSGHDYKSRPHSDLLMYNGSFSISDSTMAAAVYGFLGILIFIIAFGSVLLIYNSFSISVSERTKQFGILKSVGATRKQIRGTVLYEAMVLCGISIPFGLIIGCTGIGITLCCLSDSFSYILDSGKNVKMYLVLNFPALLLSVFICIAVTLISAWIPAKRAIKITAIDAIKQSNDVKIRRKAVRTSKLIQKIAGFEGMLAFKNFKRNSKRYRSTVVSLFLSIVLFISASSFCSYMTNMVNGISEYKGYNAPDLVYTCYADGDITDDTEKIFDIFSSVDGVKDLGYNIKIEGRLEAENKILDDGFINISDKIGFSFAISGESDDDKSRFYVIMDFIEDGEFRRYCQENGISPEKYFDTSSPKALICNEKIVQHYETNKKNKKQRKWINTAVFNEKYIPADLKLYLRREIDGYTMVDSESNGENIISYTFCKDEFVDEYYSGCEADENNLKVLGKDELDVGISVTIDDIIKDRHDVSDNYGISLYYPVSMLKYIIPSDLCCRISTAKLYFNADDHKEVYEKAKAALIDNGFDTDYLQNNAEEYEGNRITIRVVNVFAYGFIILISLIATANVFNTISTNIMLRRREFAMLRSVGFTDGGFSKMMNLECLIYGLKGLIWGLPVSVGLTYVIYNITGAVYDMRFYVPWYSVVIAVGSVFAVVFATMFYAMHKIKGDNTIDALKNENL